MHVQQNMADSWSWVSIEEALKTFIALLNLGDVNATVIQNLHETLNKVKMTVGLEKEKNWVTFGCKSSKQYLSPVIYYSQKEECVNNSSVFDSSSSNYDARYA